MKVQIEWKYKKGKKNITTFHSEWLDGEEALNVSNDLEKWSSHSTIMFHDETGVSWTKKEFQKLLQKSAGEAKDIELYFDGSYDRHSKKAGIGVIVYYKMDNQKVRYKWNEQLDELESNNEAEYAALHYGLLKLEEIAITGKKITIKGDSQGVLMQLKGEWPCFEETLNRWLDRIEAKIKDINLYPDYIPIPRNENKEADQLASQALNGKKIESKLEMDDHHE